MIRDEDISFWDDKPVGVSELNKKYEDRRKERIIGLACYGSLIDLQNFISYTTTYKWEDEDREVVEQMRETAKKCYVAMKEVETTLLAISDVFYAPIIPTENQHKIGDDDAG